MKKLLLTGAGGFVAGNIIVQAAGKWEIHGVDRVGAPEGLPRIEWHEIDLLDQPATERLVREIAPDVLIHAAAIADVDTCEAHKELAFRVNVETTRQLVELCGGLGAKIVYFSTDTIFDGERGRYREEDAPRPINYYAETKVASERIVLAGPADWVIIRPSLVMGLPVGDAGNSFLWKMIKSMRSGESVSFPQEEIRSPVDVITLARAILELAGNRHTGIFHLSGNDVVSRFEMALRICRKLGFDEKLVTDKKPEIRTGRAPRPRNASLSNEKARRTLETRMRSLEEGLDLIIANCGEKVITP